MINQLRKWQGACEINGKYFDSFPVDLKDLSDNIQIKLYPCAQSAVESTGNDEKIQSKTVDTMQIGKTYKITVKPYMTRQATPEFDFMAKFNNDNPMPLRTMIGTVEKETRGMVYMHLHGQAQEEIHCLRCGRELTNPVSRLYGIGPECLSKLGLIYDVSQINEIKESLINVNWSGWIIRSSIISKELVK